MAQIIARKTLRFNSGAHTALYPPNITPVSGRSLRVINTAPAVFLFLHMNSNQTAQLFPAENGAPFAFAIHLGISLSTTSAVIKRSSDTQFGGADGLERQGYRRFPTAVGGVHQTAVLGSCQFALGADE